MKYIVFIISLFLTPVVSFAQEVDYSETTSILMMYSLGSAVVIGIITSIIVLINGRRMKGGIFGSTLTYFGVGMFIVLLGSVLMVFPSIIPDYMENSLPSILNTVGYVIIAVAANKLLNATKS